METEEVPTLSPDFPLTPPPVTTPTGWVKPTSTARGVEGGTQGAGTGVYAGLFAPESFPGEGAVMEWAEKAASEEAGASKDCCCWRGEFGR